MKIIDYTIYLHNLYYAYKFSINLKQKIIAYL